MGTAVIAAAVLIVLFFLALGFVTRQELRQQKKREKGKGRLA